MNSKEWSRVGADIRELIAKYQEEIPVPVGKLAKELGLEVNAATLPANISGEIKEVQPGVIRIRVNRHDVKARQRFTLAHEIAHFLLHRDLLISGIQDDVLYRSNQSNKIESEANALASDILMPSTKVMSLANDKYNDLSGETLIESISKDLDVSSTAFKYKYKKIR